MTRWTEVQLGCNITSSRRAATPIAATTGSSQRSRQSCQRCSRRDTSNVLFAEADEFVIPSLTIYPDGLHGYVSQRATGYNLFHDHVLDPTPIDLSRPVLSQRGKWYPAPLYSKHVITNIALDWEPGFHTVIHPSYRDMKPDEHLCCTWSCSTSGS